LYKNGNLKKDGTEVHNYDQMGRLTGTTGTSQWGALAWTYDKAGNRLTNNDPADLRGGYISAGLIFTPWPKPSASKWRNGSPNGQKS
jgi:YD repeat-containing protein